VADHLTPEDRRDRSTTPRPDQRRSLRLGSSSLWLPRREGQSLGVPAHRRVLLRRLWPFFADLGKTPDRVKPADVLAFVHGIGKSGRTPSATTVGARIACLSPFYRFTVRMGILKANPCDALERPRSIQAPARGFSADQVRRLLAVVPDSVAGRRDRALLLTFILAGRRRTEVIGLTAGDISVEGETAFYSYRGKGEKRGRRELPAPPTRLCAPRCRRWTRAWFDAQGGVALATPTFRRPGAICSMRSTSGSL
jgi:site-specific recombinase XerC